MVGKVFTESRHAAEFILSEPQSNVCRDNVYLDEALVVDPGTVIGSTAQAATSDYPARYRPLLASSQAVLGILIEGPAGGSYVSGTGEVRACACLVRGPCEVNGNTLIWPTGITDPNKATAIANLAAKGIIVR